MVGCFGKPPPIGYEGNQRQYMMSAQKDVVVILDGYLKKPGGRLLTFRKMGNVWSLCQALDLGPFGMNRRPTEIVFNDDWLCIGSHYVSTMEKGCVYLFRKDGVGWKFHEILWGEGTTFGSGGIALTRNHHLLVGSTLVEDHGKVFCWDMNQSPPKLIQTLIPPPTITHFSSGYGRSIKTSGDTLVIQDSAAVFSPEEIKKYRLQEADKSPFIINEKRSPPNRPTILTYHRENGRWVFDADLHKLLPHPPNGVLREPSGAVLTFSSSVFLRKNITLVKDMLYLRSFHSYSMFQKQTSGQWKYLRSLVPPFPLSPPPKGSGTRFQYPIEKITIGDRYTTRLRDDGSFDLYSTVNLSKWEVLWNSHFIDESVRRALPHSPSGEIAVHRDLHCCDNLIVAEYSVRTAYDRRHPTNSVVNRGGITFFEVASTSGPTPVFVMIAKNEDSLEIVDIRD